MQAPTLGNQLFFPVSNPPGSVQCDTATSMLNCCSADSGDRRLGRIWPLGHTRAQHHPFVTGTVWEPSCGVSQQGFCLHCSWSGGGCGGAVGLARLPSATRRSPAPLVSIPQSLSSFHFLHFPKRDFPSSRKKRH